MCIVQVINRAHAFASRALLDLLLHKHDLLGRLRSLKHFFLLDQGDFFVQFMDTAEVGGLLLQYAGSWYCGEDELQFPLCIYPRRLLLLLLLPLLLIIVLLVV